jgi:hypothetical protein
MFHLTVAVKFSIDKAHVTDISATTKTGRRVLSQLTRRRKLKITHKKKNRQCTCRRCMYVCCSRGEVVSNNIIIY